MLRKFINQFFFHFLFPNTSHNVEVEKESERAGKNSSNSISFPFITRAIWVLGKFSEVEERNGREMEIFGWREKRFIYFFTTFFSFNFCTFGSCMCMTDDDSYVSRG